MNNTLQAETTSIVINICEKTFQHSDAVCSCSDFSYQNTDTHTAAATLFGRFGAVVWCRIILAFRLSSRVRSFIDARICH